MNAKMINTTFKPVMFTGTDKKLLKKMNEELKKQAKLEKQRQKEAKKAYQESPEGQKEALIKKARRSVWIKDYAKLNVPMAAATAGATVVFGPSALIGLLGVGLTNFVKSAFDTIEYDSRLSANYRADQAEKMVRDNYDRIREAVENEEGKNNPKLDLTHDEKY